MAYAPFATTYTPEPARCSGGEKPGTRILQDWVCNESPWAADLWDVGVYNCRTIGGSTTLSQHASGRAGDSAHNIVNGASHPSGIEFANWLVANAAILGVQEVICNRRRWDNQSKTWKSYGGQSPHIGHVHWTLNASGAMYLTLDRIRSVAPGGFLMSLSDAEQREILEHLRHLDPWPPERLNVVGEKVTSGGTMAARSLRWAAETVVKIRTLHN